MKKFTGILVVLLMLAISAQAQSLPEKDKNNYAVSTTKIPQLQPIILTAEALKQEDGEKFDDFQVILYGLEIEGLTDLEKMDPIVKKAQAAGVEIMVCQLSLNKLEIEPGELHPGIKVVGHAFTHLLQLQKNKNYYSITL